jgi:hypothetical protein
MKTLRKTALLAASIFALSAGAAAAQTWVSVNSRMANLENRIEAGIRSGDLTRAEARSIRADYRSLLDLEARYRVDGLSSWERSDLDRRLDQLSMRVRYERADNQDRGWYGGRGWMDDRGQWVSIERRKMQLDRRIDQGLRSGQLTRAEAARLRADFHAVARVEARYRVNGLSSWERADLDRRFDVISDAIRWERRDRDRAYGYGDR